MRIDESTNGISNHIPVTSHASCNTLVQKIQINFECNIENLSVVFPCPFCKNFVNIYLVKQKYLSFDYIAYLENHQKFVAFVGTLTGYQYNLLSGKIAHFFNKESEAIKQPLRNLRKLNLQFSEKLNMLGFAYASIFSNFMGNISSDEPKEFFNSEHEIFLVNHMGRFGLVIEVEVPSYGLTLSVNNAFERLHFVSCGSRGIEPFPFVQFT